MFESSEGAVADVWQVYREVMLLNCDEALILMHSPDQTGCRSRRRQLITTDIQTNSNVSIG